jgi:uncharacterized membrane protein YgaE (UPF0421/DUF939 family)
MPVGARAAIERNDADRARRITEMTTHSEQNKELFEYIDLRIRELMYSKRESILRKYPAKRREMIRRQITGRIYELKHLKSIIAQHSEYSEIQHMKGEWINKQKRGQI